MSSVDRRTLLANLPLFEALGERELDQLVGMTTTKRLRAREELCHKGDKGSSLYGVMSGRLKAVGASLTGKEIVFSFHEPGDVSGEIALFDEGVRTASLVAVERTEVLVLNRRELFAFIDKNPRAALKLAEGMARTVRRLSEVLEDTVFRGLPSRLAKKFLELEETYGKPDPEGGTLLDIRLPQHSIGAMVFTTRESINKQLKVWGELGITRFDRGGYVTIVDREQLENFADELD